MSEPVSSAAKALLVAAKKRYAELDPVVRGALWSHAKSCTSDLIRQSPSPVLPLGTALAFYEGGKSLYCAGEANVSVFSTSPGILLPEEHYGAALGEIWKARFRDDLPGVLSDLSRTKHPLRRSYFIDGILHGASMGVRIDYQWDSTNVRAILGRWRKELRDSDWTRYRSLCADTLGQFLGQKGVNVSEADFDSDVPLGRLRRWLTLISQSAMLVSARSPMARSITHGALIDFGRVGPGGPETISDIHALAQSWIGSGREVQWLQRDVPPVAVIDRLAADVAS